MSSFSLQFLSFLTANHSHKWVFTSPTVNHNNQTVFFQNPSNQTFYFRKPKSRNTISKKLTQQDHSFIRCLIAAKLPRFNTITINLNRGLLPILSLITGLQRQKHGPNRRIQFVIIERVQRQGRRGPGAADFAVGGAIRVQKGAGFASPFGSR